MGTSVPVNGITNARRRHDLLTGFAEMLMEQRLRIEMAVRLGGA